MKSSSYLLFLLTCYSAFTFGQENQGLVHDNFNPSNGQYINPSNIVDSKVWLDINLLGANLYGRNNVGYFSNANWLDSESLEQDIQVKTNLKSVRGYGDFEVRGPSFSLNLGKNAISIYSGSRGIVNANKIPGQLAKYAINETLESSDIGLYNVKNARIKTMAWGEIGLTYGRILKARGDNLWTGALTIKRIWGVQQANLLVNSAEIDVVAVNDVNLNSTNGKFSFVEPSLDAGKGVGASAGIHYKKMKSGVSRFIPHSKKSGCEQMNYVYKIGVSILDIGFVNFDKNTYFGTFDESLDIENLNNFDELNDEFRQNNDGEKIRSWLPGALSAQFDYNLNDFVYLNASVVQKTPFMSNVYGVERTNLLGVSARFESRYFGIGIPFSLENYVNPQLGLGVRFFNFSIGSDNVLPIFFKHKELRGGDIYFSLKFKLVNNPSCKSRTSKSSRRHSRNQKRKNSFDCPSF